MKPGLLLVFLLLCSSSSSSKYKAYDPKLFFSTSSHLSKSNATTRNKQTYELKCTSCNKISTLFIESINPTNSASNPKPSHTSTHSSRNT
jgi:hypothetical protein